MDTKLKRKGVEKYILSAVSKLDIEGTNTQRFKEMFASMNDTQFDKYMHAIQDKKTCIYMYMPNVSKRPNLVTILKIAKELGVKLFHRIKMYDSITNTYYITNEEYPVFRLPIRRLQQFLDKKMSVPKGDTKIDAITGQVAWDDRAAGITNPEIQALNSKGLKNTLHEFVAIKGGNIQSWGEMKQQAEETGVVRLSDLSTGSVTRTAMVAQKIIESMMLSTNLIEV